MSASVVFGWPSQAGCLVIPVSGRSDELDLRPLFGLKRAAVLVADWSAIPTGVQPIVSWQMLEPAFSVC